MVARIVQSQMVDAKWREFLTIEEEQQVSVYDTRIERQKRILADTYADRKSIMNRAIKRNRRHNGKT